MPIGCTARPFSLSRLVGSGGECAVAGEAGCSWLVLSFRQWLGVLAPAQTVEQIEVGPIGFEAGVDDPQHQAHPYLLL